MSEKRGEMETLDPRIKIRAPLRCDGIGSLDCAEDAESGERMAVRWLPLEAGGDLAARAVQELPPRPTLPRIRQTGRVGSAAYVAMDFPEGKLLSTLLGDPLSAELLCRVGADIADALAAVHAEGNCHGSLSADSVLVVPSGQAILWDMPLVIANRLTDRRGEERVLAELTRTAPFLSPERAQGLSAAASSDVYALAAVVCLAAGEGLPPHGSTLSLVYRIATGQWSPEVPEFLPPSARLVLARMLNRDPLARPTASEAARVLRRASQEPLPAAPTAELDDEQTVHALPEEAVQVVHFATRRPRPQPKWLNAGTVGAAAAGLLFFVVAVSWGLAGRPGGPVAALPTVEVAPSPMREVFAPAPVEPVLDVVAPLVPAAPAPAAVKAAPKPVKKSKPAKRAAQKRSELKRPALE